jgi:hypothetical protein
MATCTTMWSVATACTRWISPPSDVLVGARGSGRTHTHRWVVGIYAPFYWRGRGAPACAHAAARVGLSSI